MRRGIVLAAAMLALAGCHKRPAGAVQPEDEAAAQARTSAKALADIAAAEEAARAPLARDTTPPPKARAAARPKPAAPTPTEDDDAGEGVAPPAEKAGTPQ